VAGSGIAPPGFDAVYRGVSGLNPDSAVDRSERLTEPASQGQFSHEPGTAQNARRRYAIGGKPCKRRGIRPYGACRSAPNGCEVEGGPVMPFQQGARGGITGSPVESCAQSTAYAWRSRRTSATARLRRGSR
jgi:hypothetical protein